MARRRQVVAQPQSFAGAGEPDTLEKARATLRTSSCTASSAFSSSWLMAYGFPGGAATPRG
jgi:hypothetical protein